MENLPAPSVKIESQKSPLAPASPVEDIDPNAHKTEREASQRVEQSARQDELRESNRVLVNLDRPNRITKIKQHLTEYWGLKDATEIKKLDRIQFIEACNLSGQHEKAYSFLNDERLAGIMIAVVPDDMWVKGAQPSESKAENNLILFKESYFKGADDVGWMAHELAHCQRFLDSSSPQGKTQQEVYSEDSETPAFPDIIKYKEIPKKEVEGEIAHLTQAGGQEERIAYLRHLLESSAGDTVKMAVYYPNNKVEAHTFTMQFRYLKERGVSRENIKTMLRQEYEEEDFKFFDRLLDDVFKS